LSREDILSRFGEIEAFAEIGAAIDRPVKTYSSGMLMRLAFAVQVLCDPDILIIDEALSVGDFFFQQKCLSYIRDLCVKGVTLLFVSHDMGVVRDICARGIFISEARIAFDGVNLEAIRLYLQQPGRQSILEDFQRTSDSFEMKAETADGSLDIIEPYWILDDRELKNKQAKCAHLISIGIFNDEGMPITSAKMGSKITIKAHYKSLRDDPVHVHLTIKNKFNHIFTSVGSYNLKTNLPVLSVGQEAIFSMNIQMSMEAGDFALCVSLAQPSLDGTTGLIIDETPWLGPFQVFWNYTEEVPPFYGLAGMNCTAEFIL
jgi:lipopolysaccharide transport system ATP-binding protein